MDIEFFNSLFNGSKGYLAATFIEASTKRVSNKYYDLADLSDFYDTCDKQSRLGWNCYFVPSVMASQGRTKQDFKESNVVWMDYDKGTALPNFEEPLPSQVVQSSPGKYHVYWHLDEPVDSSAQLEAINKELCRQYDADKSGVDCTQLLRVPGTFNYKYEADTVVTVLSSYPFSYPVGSFKSFLQGHRLKLHLRKLLSSKHSLRYLQTMLSPLSFSMAIARIQRVGQEPFIS